MRRLSTYAAASLAAVTLLAGVSTARGSETSSPATAGSSSTMVRTVGDGDRIDELPKEAQGVEVKEKIGNQVPLDVEFRDSDGNPVKLATYLDGNLPVILTFNYSTCPMLCSSQLNGLVEAMRKIGFTAGEQYQIITIAIDPLETPDTAKDSKQKYVAACAENKQASIRAGWHFLTGDEASIRKLADSVGFAYRYLEETKEYSHPASLVFLSPTGVVTRYYHGIYYEPETLSTSIFQAGAGEYGVSAGFLLACFSPLHKKGHAQTGRSVLRYGAMGFVIFLLAAFGIWQMMRARSARQE